MCHWKPFPGAIKLKFVNRMGTLIRLIVCRLGSQTRKERPNVRRGRFHTNLLAALCARNCSTNHWATRARTSSGNCTTVDADQRSVLCADCVSVAGRSPSHPKGKYTASSSIEYCRNRCCSFVSYPMLKHVNFFPFHNNRSDSFKWLKKKW